MLNLPEHQTLRSIDGEFTSGAINVAVNANPSRAPGITVKTLYSNIFITCTRELSNQNKVFILIQCSDWQVF